MDICDSFRLKNHYKTNINIASSGIMARQISRGANSDIFISANKYWIDYLSSQNVIDTSSIKILTKNQLVVICPKGKNVKLVLSEDFDISTSYAKTIAIGDPNYVPIGKYASQVFKNLHWDKTLENHIMVAKDVASVLRYVELDEADWGIVYYTEAIKSDKVDIIANIPDNLHEPVLFYIALTKDHKVEAKLLFEYFMSNTAGKIFLNHGFKQNKAEF